MTNKLHPKSLNERPTNHISQLHLNAKLNNPGSTKLNQAIIKGAELANKNYTNHNLSALKKIRSNIQGTRQNLNPKYKSEMKSLMNSSKLLRLGNDYWLILLHEFF